jgi:spectinomycin phosphotransferase
MKVKYDIDDSKIIDSVEQRYGISIAKLEFIPFGDSAYSYIVICADGKRFYLKLFDLENGRQKESADRLDFYLPMTWSMYHRGLFVRLTYPIKTLDGHFYTRMNQLTLVLFNYIEGETLADSYPFGQKIIENIASSVAEIHHMVTPRIDCEALEIENFDLSFLSGLSGLSGIVAELETAGLDGAQSPSKRSLRKLVVPRKEEIAGLIHSLQTMRSKLQTDPGKMVLCHGDIWGGNLILDSNDALHFLDWESSLMAPPERDIFGYIGEEFETFFGRYQNQLYQPVTLHADLLRLYAYRRHLRNLTNWLMNIMYRNTNEAQDENDLDMIENHCMNRWGSIESQVEHVQKVMGGKA